MRGLNIEGLLAPDERMVKRQERVTARSLPSRPDGDLWLTNKQLLFLAYVSGLPPWSQIPAGTVVPLAPPQIMIPLQSITSVRKGFFGSLKVRADKEYEFAVGIWKASNWVDAVLQACSHFPSSVR